MSDQQIASVARDLAMALKTFAHERRDDDRKHIALLQTELCRVVREEAAEISTDQHELQL
jgi:hypothetical protein